MYYQELCELVDRTGAKDAVEALDRYLAFLPNKESTIITASNIKSKLNLDISIIQTMLEFLLEMSLFEKVYIVICPECGREIFTSSKRELIDRVNSDSYCKKCKEDVDITADDVFIGYKLIKDITIDEKQIKKETERLLNIDKSNNMENEQKSLQKLFEEKKENPNDFFYDPSNEEIHELKDLYNKVNEDFSCTIEKGNSLEELVKFIFDIPYGFSPSTKIRSTVNQIDCYIKNDCFFKSTVYCELGSVIKIECKNEKEKPDNNYYTKLYSIISMSKSSNEQSVGILVSRLECTRTCINLAREYFLSDNIIIINITLDELQKVIFENTNLLELIQEKIQAIKNNVHTPDAIKEHKKLYNI